MPHSNTPNTLYFGDNLDILREHIADASVDLVYLDPPFNSNRNYNILFKDEHGKEADAQIQAFVDSWQWNTAAERTYHDLVYKGPSSVAQMIGALRGFLGTSQMTAYLVMMTARLVELHRVLKPTGSLYLHCDPTASHYLKIILDAIFGPTNYRNEISWRRSNPKSHNATNFANCRDIILRYAKTENARFNKLFEQHDPEYVTKAYRYTDEQGRRYRLLPLLNPNDDRPNLTYEFLGVTRVWRWTRERMEQAYADGMVVQIKPGSVPQYKLFLDDSPGRTVTNDWNDIQQVAGKEALGYPTQKPLALLERILEASSNPGDVVLDPFCGCGTAIAAAQKLDRRWLGIDITHLAISIQKSRLKEMFPDIQYKVVGEPLDLASACVLAKQDRYQFQWWALSLVQARPVGDDGSGKRGKKGKDRGIDGIIPFMDDTTGKAKQALVQVKSGHVGSGDVRDLRGTIERENAPLGGFITLEAPTREMQTEAAAAGFYRSPGWNREYPRLQILTVEQLLRGAEFKMPPAYSPFKQAERMDGYNAEQHGLGW